MSFVYVLRDQVSGTLYVGRTNNLMRRLSEHKHEKVWTTRRMTNPTLIFYEAFLSIHDAIRRERHLKTTKGKSTLRMMLLESVK